MFSFEKPDGRVPFCVSGERYSMSKIESQFHPKALKSLVHSRHAGRLRTMQPRKLGDRVTTVANLFLGNRKKP